MKSDMHVPETRGPHAHLGPILAVIVIALLLIFIGLYLWGGMLREEALREEPPIVNDEPETPRAVADAEILSTMSPSDDLSAIEADLESTNLDSIDADLTTIEAEFGTQ